MKIQKTRQKLPLFIGCLSAVLTLSACSIGAKLSPADDALISQLEVIAGQDAKVSGDVADTECWKPSENMLDSETFRVLCRVHYLQNQTERHRDMICIGNLTMQPVTEYCYQWAFYTDMPKYEDQPGYFAESR